MLQHDPKAVYSRRLSKRKHLEGEQSSSTRQLRDGPKRNGEREINGRQDTEEQHAAATLSSPAAEPTGTIATEAPVISDAAVIHRNKASDPTTHARAAQLQPSDEPQRWMRSKILAHMESKLGRLDDRAQDYVQQLTPQQLQDLFNVIYNDMGLLYRDLEKAVSEILLCLYSSRTYRAERDMQTTRSSCMTVDVDLKGDYEVKIKVGRVHGLLFIRQYNILMHCLFAVEELQSEVGPTTIFRE
ncbi:hypothetical protein JDV02_003089 [Purpureocillium takamizusanense]|nr:uncharacterized protein JDV02_003089 [Purpureocillium takamizusanense]UNI16674.1 hypothetical protein JDV02_003089 [Purpureocillium takamizusanense]